MIGHTPGPWTRTHPEFYPIGESRWQIRGCDGELIATIEKRPKGSKDRGGANGDILAAALELMESAVSVLEWYDRDGSVDGIVEPIDALRAAVRKARGES